MALVGVTVLLCVLLVRWGAGALISLPAGLAVGLALSLWVRFTAPEGRRVRREEAPVLFRLIDRARGQLRAPEADVVLLTTDLNAGVLEKPRLGIPGVRVRYLAIGLPLLHALSEEEVHAILAHEFAHLSRQHSRSWLWLVRAQSTWKGLGAAMSGSWTSFLILPFARWYTPRLERLAQGSSRVHEHESDRLAARAAGTEVAARALLRLEVWQRLAEWRLMPALLRGSATHATPPDDLFPRLLGSMAELPEMDVLRESLDEVLRHRTLDDDSHPGCAERVTAMGVALDGPALLAGLAAPRTPGVETLLEPAFARQVAAELGEPWTAAVGPAWARNHADALVWQDPGAAENAARWARARWTAECEPERAAPLLRRVLEDDPDRAEAAVLLGMLLLREADEGARAEGVALLERESARDTHFALVAARLLRRHYVLLGRAANLRRIQARVEALEHETVRALHERQEVSARDTLRPYPLPPALHARLLAALDREPGVRGAFLVQKRTRRLDGSPLVVLAVRIRVPWYRLESGTFGRNICRALLESLHLPETLDVLVVPVEPRGALLRRLRRMPGAEIHRRSGTPAPVPAGTARDAWSPPPRLRGHLTLPRVVTGMLVVTAGLAVLRELDERSRTRPEEDGAVSALIKAAQRDVNDADAQAALAQALMERQRWAEAEPTLARAVQLSPDRADRLNALGSLRVRLGEPQRALAPLHRAVELRPADAAMQHNLAMAYHELGRVDEAERWLLSSLRHDSTRVAPHTQLGWLLLDRGDYEAAEMHMRMAVRLEENGLTLQALAEVQRWQGRLRESLATLTRATSLPRATADLWGERGYTEARLGDLPAAAASFARAEELDPTYFARNAYHRKLRDAARAGRMPPEFAP